MTLPPEFVSALTDRVQRYGSPLLALLVSGIAPVAFAATSIAYDAAGNTLMQQAVSGTAPVIVRQPKSRAVGLSDGVGFSVVASSSAPVSYQWKRNGVDIPGATGDSYYIPGANQDHQADYSAVVSIGALSVTSNAASLAVATRNLVAWWRAEENPDDSVGSNHGTLGSGATYSPGKTGSAFSFNSDSARVSVPKAPPADLGPKLAWTIEGWVRPTSFSARDFPTIYSEGRWGLSLGILKNSGLLEVWINNNTRIWSDTRLRLNEWNHVALVYDSAGLRFFVNGMFAGSGPTVRVNPDSNGAAIGNITGQPSSSAFSGQIDELSLYDYALSVGEILAIASRAEGAKPGVAPPALARLANLSVRAAVGSGDQTLIVGFAVAGGGSKRVVLRAVGPGLVPFGVGGAVADPELGFYSGNALFQRNNDWGGGPLLSETFARVGAFPLSPASKDSAMNLALGTGAYTAQVSSTGVSGVALVEAYDADSGPAVSRLVNLSARNFVGTGDDTLIVGFVVTGSAPKTLLIRGIGPTLGTFGVGGALVDPGLQLFRGDTLVSGNDNWGGSASLADAFVQVGAFALPAGSRDAALLVSLSAGAYTVQVSGNGGTTGIALAEVYEVP